MGLLVVEVWIAIILMTSAFLFVRSLRKLHSPNALVFSMI